MKINVEDIASGRLTEDQAKALQKYFKDGGTWSEILEIDPKHVEELYAKAYEFYGQKDYDQALGAFSALIQLNPYVPAYWLGIGASLQGQKAYEDAIASYGMALVLDAEYIHALYYSAQCHFSLEKYEECKELLKKVISLQQKEPQLAQKAAQILELMR